MKTQFTRISIILAGLVVVLATVAFFGMQYISDSRPDMTTIETIKANMKSPGKFYTAETTVCVDSVDDLGYICKDTHINLYYGKVLVNIPYKSLNDEEYMKALEEIGIKVYSREDESGDVHYKLTYWGDTITEWSRVE